MVATQAEWGRKGLAGLGSAWLNARDGWMCPRDVAVAVFVCVSLSACVHARARA